MPTISTLETDARYLEQAEGERIKRAEAVRRSTEHAQVAQDVGTEPAAELVAVTGEGPDTIEADSAANMAKLSMEI